MPVIWDYHVVLLLRQRDGGPSTWVYDFDTELALPCKTKGIKR
jgi:hypothetical protein